MLKLYLPYKLVMCNNYIITGSYICKSQSFSKVKNALHVHAWCHIRTYSYTNMVL